ncbi:sulfatase [Ruania alba]|uniref:sulfatase n=1 Tax=Ruania alba TaxID=648782 RepID=UPI0024819B7B|nr:sulfatase [Ruania alba]
MYAGPAGAAHRTAQLPAPLLGPARTLRRLHARTPQGARHLHPPGHRSPALLRRRRGHLSHPVQQLGVLPWAGGRPLEGACRWCGWHPHRGQAAQTSPGPDQPRVPRDGGRPPQTRTFDAGLEFIDTNKNEDGWFLQLETFDPHEPFFSHKPYKDLYPHEYDGPEFDWPSYAPVAEPGDQVAHARYEYAALLSMCDESLGRVLDVMDENQMWDDTLLIVCTDHGYLLGENGWWAKLVMPWYDSLVHTPLFVWDPRSGAHGERRSSLVQTIDIAPTLLDWFGLESTPDMQGVPLARTVSEDQPVREAGLFGSFGAHVNVTDGRYVYMRAPDDPAGEATLHDYTIMPTRMRGRFSVDDLAGLELAEPFTFTKGLRTLRVPAEAHPACSFGTLLFDLTADPRQQTPITDPEIEHRMIGLLHDLLVRSDAPDEQFDRLGLPRPGEDLDGSPHWLRAHRGRDRAVQEATEMSHERRVAHALARLAPGVLDYRWLNSSVHQLTADPVAAPVIQRHAPGALRDELLTVGPDITLLDLAVANPELVNLESVRAVLDALSAASTAAVS